MPDLETRQRFIQYLKERDILAVFHYVPLHTADMSRSFGYQAGDLPVTEEYSDRLVRLPFYNSMTEAEQQQVINTILTFQP